MAAMRDPEEQRADDLAWQEVWLMEKARIWQEAWHQALAQLRAGPGWQEPAVEDVAAIQRAAAWTVCWADVPRLAAFFRAAMAHRRAQRQREGTAESEPGVDTVPTPTNPEPTKEVQP